jgi:translation initiation factor IF-2
MSDGKTTRLSKAAREFNVGISTILDFLNGKGHKIESNPNTKISQEMYDLLVKEYSKDGIVKKESEKVNLRSSREKSKETVTIKDIQDKEDEEEENGEDEEVIIKQTSLRDDLKNKIKEHTKIKVIGKIDLEGLKGRKPAPPEKEAEKETPEKETETANDPIIEDKIEEVAEPKELEPVAETTPKEPEQEPPVEELEELEEVEEIEEVEEVEEGPAEGTEEGTEEEIKPLEGSPDRIESETLRQLKKKNEDKDYEVKVLGKIDLDAMNQKTRPARKTREEKEKERQRRQVTRRDEAAPKEEATAQGKAAEDEGTKRDKGEVVKTHLRKISAPIIVGKIQLPSQQEDGDGDDSADKKKKRKRIKKEKERVNITDEKEFVPGKKSVIKATVKKKTRSLRPAVNEEDVEKQVKDTLARLTSKTKSKGAKYRREKRDAYSQKMQEEVERQAQDKNILKVTEFVSVNELATMMNVPVVDIISTCMSLGLFVSINQRLDAETMALVADEFNYKVEFISVEVQEAIQEEEDLPEDLLPRPPIVTVMGHVDHGKTKLLDFIRSANVIAGEAGGITQHIGAYGVELEGGKQITFLDTPGHEAFTAMRARGAQVTDIAIIVVAADDGVKPQTVEAINHAHAAGVPIVFALNKIDKPTANPEKVKEELANLNFLVEDWGGKYQSQEISAISGQNIPDLLEKVLLEAELLDLKANPNKNASGTVVESTLDKGRGYVATVLVENGTLNIGDVLIAGIHHGHVKAMYNERGNKVEVAGPSTPVLILGLNGAPQAGDKFNVMGTDKEAKEIANKREQLQREQGMRTQKHITLDEIGRRIAIGNFQELNIIVKGDVDGSVEALSDSLIKLSNNEIQVNIIHKGVGQISESDILLATASDAIIVGFQVRPSVAARKAAEKEEIDIRIYSIIYDAIEEIKSAMEGMLSPEIREEITATAEVKDVFKITKVGTIAGCIIKEGKLKRTSKVRVIREGIVVNSGVLGSLKRFKDDVKEVYSGQECGLNIENYNDINVGDIIEAYTETEVRKTL